MNVLSLKCFALCSTDGAKNHHSGGHNLSLPKLISEPDTTKKREVKNQVTGFALLIRLFRRQLGTERAQEVTADRTVRKGHTDRKAGKAITGDYCSIRDCHTQQHRILLVLSAAGPALL